MFLILVSSRWVTGGACLNFKLVSLAMRWGAGERWTVLLSTYCVPAANQEAEPRKQGLACLLVFRAAARGATRASRNVGVKVGPLLRSNLTGPAGLQAPRKCSWGE